MVGDESSIFFWHSRWCDNVSLRDRFPSLFVLATERDTRVRDYLGHFHSLVVWSPVFFRPTFLEDDSIHHLLAMLDSASPKASSLDTVRWSITSTRKFTVKSYFLHLSSFLSNSSSSLSDCDFTWNII